MAACAWPNRRNEQEHQVKSQQIMMKLHGQRLFGGEPIVEFLDQPKRRLESEARNINNGHDGDAGNAIPVQEWFAYKMCRSLGRSFASCQKMLMDLMQ